MAAQTGAWHMKVLMVSEDLPGAQLGGLGKHVVTMANALLDAGHEVAILGRKAGDPAVCGFQGRFIGAIALAHPNWKESQLGCFNPVKRPWFARHLATLIARHASGFDVVHYHGHLPLVGAYVDRACPFVQTRHDQGSDCLVHLRFRGGAVCDALDARACAGCIGSALGLLRQHVSAMAVDGYRDRTATAFARHKTIFVSDFLRRRFQQARPAANLRRARVIPNVVDMARLQAAGSAPEPGHIVLAGRIDIGKGFDEFLAAAHARLPREARITIVGDGPGRAGLARRYASAHITFTGWRDYDSTVALTARAQLCIVPSVCEEACSTTVLEALALGRPCLALARGGTPELLRYQRYPGQLQLAPTMAALVDAMAPLLAAPVPAFDVGAPFGADVRQVLPQLLDYYAA
jgi:glycosyltransferase involved in cell wall biosynthesis